MRAAVIGAVDGAKCGMRTVAAQRGPISWRLVVLLFIMGVVTGCSSPSFVSSKQVASQTPSPPVGDSDLPIRIQTDCAFASPADPKGGVISLFRTVGEGIAIDQSWQGDLGEVVGLIPACVFVDVTDVKLSEISQVYFLRVEWEDFEGWISSGVVDWSTAAPLKQ